MKELWYWFLYAPLEDVLAWTFFVLGVICVLGLLVPERRRHAHAKKTWW